MTPDATPFPGPRAPRARAQRGASLLFAMMTVVALSLAAVALIRSVDTGTTILGNLSFKQDTLLAADRGTRLAVDWILSELNTSSTSLDTDRISQDSQSRGYLASVRPGLDPASTSPAADRVAIDWNDDQCRSQRGPSVSSTNCLRPVAPIDMGRNVSVRYLIVRLCSGPGSSSSPGVQCPRPIHVSSVVTGERGEINSQNPSRLGTATLTEYYRVIVRARGARNTISTTETLVHF
ncbi:MAG: hypothetical protein RL456_3265 [Pseudomonadota bacterium]|jgi:hypothetical protein